MLRVLVGAVAFSFALSACGGGKKSGGSDGASLNRRPGGGTTNPSPPDADLRPTIAMSSPSSALVNSLGTVDYTVTYTGASAITLTASDVSLVASSGNPSCAVAVTGVGLTTRTITLSACTGTGTLGVYLAAGTAVNLVGLPALAFGSSPTVNVDAVGPTVSLSAPSSVVANGSSSITYTVTYTDAASVSLASGDITKQLTGNANCNVGVSGAGTATRTVTLDSCVGNGTVGISIAAGTALDVNGNLATSAGPSATFTVDTVIPGIAIGAPSVAIARGATSVTYTVSYTNATAITLASGDLTLNLTGTAACSQTVSGVGTTTRTVTLHSCTGDGTVGISIAAGTASSLGGNLAPSAGPSATFTEDNTVPSVSISAPSTSLADDGSTITYTVTYSGADAVTLANGNITQNSTGTATCSHAVSGAGTVSRTVTLTGCTGDGTIGISVAAGTAGDTAGNAALGAGPSTSFTVDNTAPTVSISAPSANVVNAAGSIDYVVTYAGASSVTLAAGDVSLNTTGGASCSVAVTGAGAVSRTVTLSSCSGNGTVGISLAASTASDAIGNLAASAGPSTPFTVDTATPGIALGAPSVSVARSGTPVSYTVTYTGAATVSLLPADVSLNLTGTATCSFSVSGSGVLTRTITLHSCSGDGTVGISIAAGTAESAGGNAAPAVGPSTTFTEDNTAPTFTIGAPTASVATNADSVAYTVTYAGASAVTLVAANVTLNSTGGATCDVAVTGAGVVTRTVTLSNCAGDGTAGISIASSTASDTAGNSAVAGGPSATFTVDNTDPGVSISGPSQASASGANTVTYTVTYTGASAVTLGAGDVSLNTTGGASCTIGVSGTGTASRTVSLSACTGNGTVGISIDADTASDSASNSAPAAGPSSTFTVDTSGPTLSIGAPSATHARSGVTVSYTLTYTGATSVNLVSGDVQLETTGTAVCSVAVSGTGTATRTVQVHTCSGNGTVGISVAAGTASDGVGNLAPTAGPSTTFIEDNLAPTVSLSAASSSVAATGDSVTYTVTYGSADAVTLADGNITLNLTGTATCSHAVTGAGTATRTVTLTSCSGDGTAGITVAAGTASDTAGNTALGAGPSGTFTVDNSGPGVSIGAPSASSTNSGGTITYTVSYTGASSVTLANANVTLNTTGSASCSHSVSGAGTATRTVTLTSCSGDGTVGLSIAAGTATDSVANAAAAAGPSTTFTVDNSGPGVSVGAPSAAAANALSTITYTVTYTGAASVTLADGDVTLNTTGTATCSHAVTGVGTATRTVTLTACSGDGTVGISVASSTAADALGNLAAAAGPSGTFSVDTTSPGLSIGAPSHTHARAGTTVSYTLTYTGASAVSLVSGDIVLDTTGTATCSVAVSGTGVATRTVQIHTCSGNGTVGISVAAGTASDAIGNLAPAAGPSTTFVEDNIAPTLSIGAPSESLVNSSDSIAYVVTYTSADSVTLANGDVSLNTTGTATCSAAVSGAGTATRTVTLTSCTGDGTVGITLAAASSADTAGNLSLGAGPSATFAVDNTAPTLVISAPSVGSADLETSVEYTVTYTGADSVTLAALGVTVNTTGTATCSKAVTGAGTVTRTVTLSACSGSGTAGITIAMGSATDTAGNLSVAAGPSATFTVSGLPPAPTGLSATAGNRKVSLSWNSVAGATSYAVKRATVSGGAYTTIAAAEVGTTYEDLSGTLANATPYYYVVTATTVAGTSADSTEDSATPTGVNLVVPIEMLDRGATSRTSAWTVLRSRTSLNTSDYDGSPTYSFEISANNSAALETVTLSDSAGNILATVNVPTTSGVERFAPVSFTPNSGADTYRIRLSATAADDTLQVHSARILVKQTQASKTALYIPLLGRTSLDNTEAGTLTTGSTSYLGTGFVFQKEAAFLSAPTGTDPWTLEVVTGGGSDEGDFRLYDQTAGSAVGGATVSYASGTANPTLASTAFANADMTDDHVFELQFRTAFLSTVSVARAGLWLRLDRFDDAVSFWRLWPEEAGIANASYLDRRMSYSSADYSNPAAYSAGGGFESTSGTISATLGSLGNGAGGDSSSSISSVPSSGFTLNSASPVWSRSSLLNLTADDRYTCTTSGTGALTFQCFLLIHSSR